MKKVNIILWITGILTTVITGIMDFVLFPTIEKTTQGIKCFDMNSFGYSFETAKKFLELISDEGRDVYLHIQLPLDFVYPVIYTVFFILMIYKLSGKISPLFGIPVLLILADYTENICSIKMLKAKELSEALASFASTSTIIKSILMYLCFIIIIILAIKYFINKKQTKNNIKEV